MIEYELGRCSLGSVLIAMSERGVCAIALNDEPSQLIDWLKYYYPHARKGIGSGNLLSCLQRVVNYVEGSEDRLDFKLDIQGTTFQKRVWQKLQAIPTGETRSYSEIAREMGVPHSVRAIAGACAKNMLALAIPCHRVIRQDGNISGYRWGVERKKRLLQKEAIYRLLDT